MSRYLVVKRFGVSTNLCVPKSCLISTQKNKGQNKEDQKRERPESPLLKKHKKRREREREKKQDTMFKVSFHFLWIDRRRDLSRSIFDTKKGRHTHHPISLLRPL